MAITAKQPIQIRLSDTELAALDAYRASVGRFPPDRATVVKQALLDWLWEQAGGGPREDVPSAGPALLEMEEAGPAPALPPVPAPAEAAITPLQQAVLAVPSPQAVEVAAMAPVPELELSVDLPGTIPAPQADNAVTRERERKRRNAAAYRARQRERSTGGLPGRG